MPRRKIKRLRFRNTTLRNAVVILLIGVALEVILYFIEDSLKFDLFQKSIIGLQVPILVFVIHSLWESALDTKESEFLYKIDEALTRAQETQKSAQARIDAVWAIAPYNQKLKEYFKDTLSSSSKILTRRVIDIANINIDCIVDHIKESWDYIGKSYEIYINRNLKYEIMIIDNSAAELFFIFWSWARMPMGTPYKPKSYS